MKYIKKIPLYILLFVSAIALGYGIATAIGITLPERYNVSKSKSFKFNDKFIFNVLVDVSKYPAWKPYVKKVELLGRDENYMIQWREFYVGGKKPVTFKITKRVDPEWVEVRVSDTLSKIEETLIFRVSSHQSRGVLTIKKYARIQKPFNRFEA